MKGNADMTDVQDGFALLPEGEYLVKIAEVQDGFSKGGDPMPQVKFEVVGGEYDGQWVWENITISNNPESKAFNILWRVKVFLKCIGEPHEGKIEFDTDNWIGRKLKVRLYHDTYNGKKKAKVGEFIALEGSDAVETEEIPF